VIRRALAVVALIAAPLSTSLVSGIEGSVAYAAGGTLDTSFGSGTGFAVINAATTNARFFAAPTGEPVITIGGGGFQWDTDGTTLTGWSGSSGINFPTDAAIDGSGRAVVIGGNMNSRLSVARYTDGVLDSTFGTGGIVDLPYDPNGSEVAAASDGSVMVSAGADLVKLTPEGALDASWNPSGTTPGIETVNGVWGLRFQGDGHLVVICAMDWQQNDPCLERFNPDGSADTTFGSGGKAPGFSAQGLGQTEYWTIAIGGDDSIYAGGADLTNAHPVVAKYTAGGAADSTFGNAGVAVNPTSGPAGEAPQFRYLLLTGDSVYAGMVGAGGAGIIARYTSAGQLDPAFATNGQVPVPQPNNTGFLFGIAVQPSGKLLVAVDSGGAGLYTYRLGVEGVDPVSSLTASGTSSGASLSWANPPTPSFDQAIVRLAQGQTPPTTATSGTAAYAGSGSSVAAALPAGRDYAASVFVSDFAGNTSTATTALLHGTTIAATGSKTVNYGSATTISATLKTVGGSLLANQAVRLYAHPAGATSWSKVAVLTTNRSGAVAKSVAPRRNFVYQFAFTGAPSYLHSARTVTVTVKPRLVTTWGPLTFSHATGTSVKGTVAPAGVIELQRLVSGAWRNVTKITVHSGHTSWRFTVKPRVGKSTYRVFVPRQGGRAAAASTSRRLTAR
jgi:uncharacterized delta-60 repeat protein